jgi:hypothetical protein
MNTYITSAPKNPTLASFKFIFVMLFVALIGLKASAQSASGDKNVNGIVRFSEDNTPAPGVNIYLKGSTATGTYSDANGKFEFPRQLKSGDVLVFSFIGRKTTEYSVSDQPVGFLDIVLGPEYLEMVEDVLVEGAETSRPSAFARLFRRAKSDR